ncbi:MAG: hypothetical protein Q8K60_04580 [Parachlamydiaceae bacterium]|nr:hypothetical protein [Parachlamydiaceae bacterium]
MINYFILVFFLLFGTSIQFNQLSAESTALPPSGLCVFDIDSTLTEPGSMAAVSTCVELGYGIGINTGEDKGTAQRSMNAIYNGLSDRGSSLDHLHTSGKTRFYDYILSIYTDKGISDVSTIIGDGTDTADNDGKPLVPGDVNKDELFQYSGGCKEGTSITCTNNPYKYEGLESVASFYYPEYPRSDPKIYPQGKSSEINECVILFDDQLSTVERFANNLQEGALSDTNTHSKKFRAIYINEPSWTIDNEENAKNTVCKTIKNLAVKCQNQQIIDTVCVA